jgi:hypothetical protein
MGLGAARAYNGGAMRALLFSLVPLAVVTVVVGTGAFAGAAHAQSSGASPAPSGAAQSAPPSADEGDPAARPKPKLGIESLLRPRAVTPRSATAPPAATEETYGGRNQEAWTRAFNDAYD